MTLQNALSPLVLSINATSFLTLMTLFTKVKYHISSSFTSERKGELAKILDANGAQEETVSEATHVIAKSLKFEGWDAAAEDVAIVTVKYT